MNQFTLPPNNHLHMRSRGVKTPGLSEFGLKAEGVIVRPGMDEKNVPDLQKPWVCTPRLQKQ